MRDKPDSRLKVIERCLKSNSRTYWKKSEILKWVDDIHYNEGYDTISERTLSDDLRKLRKDGFVTERHNIGWKWKDRQESLNPLGFDEVQLRQLKNAVNYLARFDNNRILEDVRNPLRVLSRSLRLNIYSNPERPLAIFEQVQSDQEAAKFDVLLDAIESKRMWLHFTYKHLWNPDLSGPKLIFPMQLKQWKMRWYLIGKTQNDSVNQFALERICDVQTSEAMPPKVITNSEYDLINAGVGVNNFEGTAQKVVFLAHPYQSKYLEERKLHDSQKPGLLQKEGWSQFEITVVINEELKMALLQWGDRIKVLEPKELRDSISDKIKAMAEFYRA